MIEIIDVQSREHLDALLPEWLAAPAVALDTEFLRERTYYPIAGLIQLSIGGPVYLIDPLAIDDLSPLRKLFEAPVVKVLHSASEDLEVFQRVLGGLPAPLADTQVGAALAGHRFGIGYQSLVETLLGRTLDKGETRSDWLQRPLSDSQRYYAAMDVAWLLPVYQQLCTQLQQEGRIGWWQEEDARTVLEASRTPPLAESWRRLKGAGRLRPRELATLQSLCAWREQTARRVDRPRGHIIKDAVCLELARRAPQTIGALTACEGVVPRLIKPYSEGLLEAIGVGRKVPLEHCPQLPRPLSRAEGEQLRELRALAEERAAELQIAPELLIRRRDLEALLRDRSLPPTLQGWRRKAIGEMLQGAMSDDGKVESEDLQVGDADA